jgi:hypothetical protein
LLATFGDLRGLYCGHFQVVQPPLLEAYSSIPGEGERSSQKTSPNCQNVSLAPPLRFASFSGTAIGTLWTKNRTLFDRRFPIGGLVADFSFKVGQVLKTYPRFI